MYPRAMTKVMRHGLVATLAVTGTVWVSGCAGGAELTPETAREVITAHPEFQDPPNLGVYGGEATIVDVTNITAEGGSRASVDFTWRYDRNFQETQGNVPSTLFYTRMLDGRPREGHATLVQEGGQWRVESLDSLWQAMLDSTPVASTTYDDPR